MFALGYANNLLGLFVFLIISFAVTSMYIANRNMQFTFITDIQAQDIFAEQENSISITVNNSSDISRFDYSVSYQKSKNKSLPISEIEAQRTSTTTVNYAPQKRGYQKLPRFEIQSLYPFGMLKTWRYYWPKEEILVYPSLKGSHEFPLSDQNSNHSGEQGLFRDHKIYAPGDSTRRINWIKSSRYQEILVKNYESNQDQSYEFHWEQTARLLDFEKRISQLALWVHNCEQSGKSYSLTLKSKTIPTSKGLLHYRDCMKLLATLKEETL